jgi:cytidine deaminase
VGERKLEDAELVARAGALAGRRVLSPTVKVGDVGCALETARGAVHVGVNIDAACGIGFCAEHAAIASMVTSGESQIARIVAVDSTGRILPPCGRCRELIYQTDPANGAARVILADGAQTLEALLPLHWKAR